MDKCFRIRFVLGRRLTIDSPEKEVSIPDPVEDKIITLRAGGGAESLAGAEWVALLGCPFGTEDDASTAAYRWLGVLKKAFAKVNLGADFGDRAPKSAATVHGLRMMEEQTGQRVLNDVHGVSVYDCDPLPRFASMRVELSVGRNADALIAALQNANEAGVGMRDVEQLAYDLYAASFSESTADARFAMLMMAVETLLDPAPREAEVRKHVDNLIVCTQSSDLQKVERDSIVGALRWLYKESINQAGRQLAAKLGNRRYMEKSETAEQLFSKCYDLRSALFHGVSPRPSREDVDARSASLERFVADLLALGI